MNKTLLVIATVTPLFSGAVFAGSGKTSQQVNPEISFNELDFNRNGLIGPGEAVSAASLDRNFEAVDINDDNAISRAEFSAFESAIESEPPHGQRHGSPQQPTM